MTPEVWIIDDERSIRDALSQTLDIEGFEAKAFSSAKEALSHLNSKFEGVIISDINMPQMDGMAFLERALRIDPELSIVMLTGHGDISTAVSAMRNGAYDFLEKPFSSGHLLDVLSRGIDKRRLVMENRELKRELETQSAPGPRIMGNSDAVKALRRSVYNLKDSDCDILLQGERGTGKELAARLIHDQGNRQDSPFVSIKCRQIPEALIDIELFGSNQRNVTTQPSYKNSKVEAANAGTLFIDGIEALPISTQTALATLLQTKHRPRIIASSRVELAPSVTLSKFDASLLKLLSSNKLTFPPLRERGDDVITLCQNIVRTTASRFGIAPPVIDTHHKDKLLHHSWPGNVRELRAFAERWVLMGDDTIGQSTGEGNQESNTLSDRLQKVERTILFDSLHRHNGMLKEVQNELGLARKTLYEKLKKHHLDKENFKGC